jgi:hypothetical protein
MRKRATTSAIQIARSMGLARNTTPPQLQQRLQPASDTLATEPAGRRMLTCTKTIYAATEGGSVR